MRALSCFLYGLVGHQYYVSTFLRWQRRLATKSGNDFGLCNSERLISLFQTKQQAACCGSDRRGQHVYCDAICYHGIVSSVSVDTMQNLAKA